jgi:hypothetical protein
MERVRCGDWKKCVQDSKISPSTTFACDGIILFPDVTRALIFFERIFNNVASKICIELPSLILERTWFFHINLSTKHQFGHYSSRILESTYRIQRTQNHIIHLYPYISPPIVLIFPKLFMFSRKTSQSIIRPQMRR